MVGSKYYYALVGFSKQAFDQYREFRGRLFDVWYGTDTGGKVAVDDLGISDEFKPHAINYQPTKVTTFAQAMKRLPVDDPSRLAFVDFGCGKGRCLLMAAQLGFGKVVGIELSERLCSVAKNNIRKFQNGRHHSRIEVQFCSSLEAQLPDQPSLYFFYNPFDEKLMSETLEYVCSQLDKNGIEAWSIYINPRHKHVFPAHGFHLVASGKRSGEQWTMWNRKPKVHPNEPAIGSV